MFSFLSRLRLPTTGTQSQEDEDDTSSLGRSLNLPWPVTESSARRSASSTTPRRDWTANHTIPQSTGNGINISYPIPRTANSLTGFDSEFPAPPSGSSFGEPVQIYGQGRPTRASPLFSGLGQGAWYEQEKPTKANVRTQIPYAPPEVVRLDSNAHNAGTDATNQKEDKEANSQPPSKYAYKYTSHPSASSYALPYPTSGDNGANAPLKSNQPSKTDWNEYETESEHEFYTSPFDSDPLDVFPTTPRTGNVAMTKSRWNLKLQLHSSGAQSTPSLPAGNTQPVQTRIFPHFASQNPLQRQTHPNLTPNGPGHTQNIDVNQYSMPVSVDTDVYNNAYNYPLAKQLSPIAEQDYISPSADPESRSVSLRFARGRDGSFSKASPGAESTIGSVLGGGIDRKDKGGNVTERESIRTKTGSVGSVGNDNLSRAGSASMGVAAPVTPGGSVGSEIARPSPIYASPFITRHLNRTVSQTSSKSDSQPQVSSQTQTPTATQPQALSQGHAPTQRTIGQLSTTQVPRSTTTGTVNLNANSSGREFVQTPTSAGTTATTLTGSMYTPTSAIVQTPIAQTPTSPVTAGGTSIQAPPTAVTTNTLQADGSYHSTARLLKIPSLPNIPPLDLRFSLLGSVGPRASREIRRDRTSKAGSTAHRSLGEVERMPVIHGSVEGFYGDEEDEDENEREDDHEDLEEEEEEEEEEESEAYDRESLHAESFVTAGTNEDANVGTKDPTRAEYGVEGVELADLEKSGHTDPLSSRGSIHSRIPSASASNSNSLRSLPAPTLDQGGRGVTTTPKSTNGDSFIHRRWDRDAALGFGGMSSSPTTFRAKGHNTRWPMRMLSTMFSSSSSSTFTPAFWAFWLGFICPVLWLVGGWHFTNAGELPPKYTMWEWYFWSSRWSVGGFKVVLERTFGCCSRRRPSDGLTKAGTKRGSQEDGGPDQTQRRKGKRRSIAQSKARAGKIFPALPQWVAEKQSTDDGRMRLNDPKRSLRGISFGYPFISRPPGSQDSCGIVNPPDGCVIATLAKPNRVLDLLYGVQLKEVRGRPESGRRMFDPWIQRCRYAFCYGMLLLAAGLCTASAYLITVNTKKLV